MRGERTPLANGALFGLVTGLSGGLMWGFIVFLESYQSPSALRWFLIAGGFLFWFFVGFLVGAFNAPRNAKETSRQGGEEHSFVQKMLVAVGWFLYRIIVGWVVGIIATLIFSFIASGIWFGAFYLIFGLKNVPRDSPALDALGGGMMTGMFCCFFGSVFGALMVTRRNPAHRPAISSRALRSSFLGILLGVAFGAALRLPPDEETSNFVYLAMSLPVVVFAGILGGLWTDMRNVRRTLKDGLILRDVLLQDAVDDVSPSQPEPLNDSEN